MTIELLAALVLLCLLVLAHEVGFRCGQRATADTEGRSGGQIAAAQGAVLGLLGLLLGFSFAGASSRFMERQDLIATEANAIGTAYIRCDVLDEPQRSALRESLSDYTRYRVAASQHLRLGLTPQMVTDVRDFHTRMWHEATTGIAVKPSATMIVLPAVNDVIDLHSRRIAAAQKHLPGLVFGLLITCSLLAMAVMGYGSGLSNRRHAALHVALAILIGIALFTIIDMDHPRAGIIQLSDRPLADLRFDARQDDAAHGNNDAPE